MSETSQEAANTAREIIKLKDKLITRLYENSVSSVYAVKLIDLLFEMPLISNKNVVERSKVSTVTANELVRRFVEIGVLREITGKKRYKRYIFKDYVEIIARGTKD